MREIRIKRTDKEDLLFTGKILAKADDLKSSEKGETGIQLVLYQTRVRALVLAISVHGPGSDSLHAAVFFSSVRDIHEFSRSREGRGLAHLIYPLLEQLPGKTDRSVKRQEQESALREGQVHGQSLFQAG